MQTRTERLHNVCLALTAYNPVPTQNRAECSPGSRRDLEAFTVSSPGMKLLDELMAKLEFENELNRVCNSFSVNGNTPSARGDSTGSEDSGVDEGASDGEEDEKDVSLMDTVLDMEQDYELLPLI
ncbi:hypothetical protein Q7C36_020540 [Tachysurus vachellii]|uniref:Uncharacterized protein n=1 Tax=Tachysurus vachellii TaxID=175792 RepID=A0AA88LQP7_TACVA|nr:hypothetical protein Q7C36_020540 [Tachysurus vachellii]